MLTERVLHWTNEELANMRGQLCPVESCNEHDCPALCDRCLKRHGTLIDGHTICVRCAVMRECSNCGVVAPKFRLVNVEGDLFCGDCSHTDPEGELW